MSAEKKAQIWIESVLYMLIGLALIGLALTFVTPRINESKDRLIVEQSVNTMNILDEKIKEVIESGAGNVRRIEALNLKEGEIFFDSATDQIILKIGELENPYSEEGVEIEIGEVVIISGKTGGKDSVSLKLDYSGIYDITFEDSQNEKVLTAASTPYSIYIENNGQVGAQTAINIYAA